MKTTNYNGIPDVKIIENIKYEDNRGFFIEKYNSNLGFKTIQDNFAFSKKNVLRGLHYQKEYPQAKIITCVKGKILDVFVDLRTNSESFLKYGKVALNGIEKSILIPRGFAHGYLALEEENIVYYKVDNYYKPEYEERISWKDKKINIDWELEKYGISEKDLIISEKDKKL
ncbi:dTDP-4-dehydrorhamnose 3,5-epimerase [Geotoga petraea]|jgi:dTDP-4-dehydrorhamnose 3,5-epimerase|uniref:dTDP-4-dehydrorhamnose 3,5-epimerase n=1 Tax=Geotoga petraea TaxID=28234 RepID=A0A1G6HQL8_9BACT|nr:dTDP-4-dehydrorhamnose 3,5-epimerase [Geotoga petraea]TGG88923.1 dTDP-4-dehydrorhamnose 3,5-epimerase [Geotoga petraea]SDB96532.1 dTDP-4-dehydrorhamnose 3,5-epimerase [Geotoga petraea]